MIAAGNVVGAEVFWQLERMGDGYDTMTGARRHGWRAVPSWGRDGWDLGSWPYAVVYHRAAVKTPGNRWGLAEVVEGDVTAWEFDTEAERDAATDALALWHWQHNAEPWVQRREGREPYTADTMPEHLRGAYSRERAS